MVRGDLPSKRTTVPNEPVFEWTHDMTRFRLLSLLLMILVLATNAGRGTEIPDETWTRSLGPALDRVYNSDITYSQFELRGRELKPLREKVADYVGKAMAAWRSSPDPAVQRSLREGLGLDPKILHSSWSDHRILRAGKNAKYIRRIANANHDQFDDLVYTEEDGVATRRQKFTSGKEAIEISAGTSQYYIPRLESLFFRSTPINVKENLKGESNGLLELAYHPGDDPDALARAMVDPKLQYLLVSLDTHSSEKPPTSAFVRLEAINLYPIADGFELPVATFFCKYLYHGDEFVELTLTLIHSAVFNHPSVETNLRQPIPKDSIVWLADKPGTPSAKSARSMRTPDSISPKDLLPILETEYQKQLTPQPPTPVDTSDGGWILVRRYLLAVLIPVGIGALIYFRRRSRDRMK